MGVIGIHQTPTSLFLNLEAVRWMVSFDRPVESVLLNSLDSGFSVRSSKTIAIL